MIKLYHQLGFRYKWNFVNYENHESGQGFIIAPRSLERSAVDGLDNEIKNISIFDPQFFMPDQAKGKLDTYDFYPSVLSEDFDTAVYENEMADKGASSCVSFQVANGFNGVIIPTRFRQGSPEDFIESQMKLFVEPFLSSIQKIEYKGKVYLQFVATDNILGDKVFFSDIMNWLVSINGIDGIYVIPYLANRNKQIDDLEFLKNVLRLIGFLRQNELEVIVGYSNTESILYSVADPNVITMGSYENLRMFDPENFVDEDKDSRGPKARIYVPSLFQWIEAPFIDAIRQNYTNGEGLLPRNEYLNEMFQEGYKYHFAKPQPYHHYMLSFSEQFQAIANASVEDRFDIVSEEIKKAMLEFDNIEGSGVVLGKNNDGRHLPAWLTALNLFRKEFGS